MPAEVYVHAFMPGDDELLISNLTLTNGIYALAIDGSQELRPIVMDGIRPELSPDGTLLAYVGIEGANLVPRVRRLDASGPGVSIATQNNRNLNWSHDGRELYLGVVKGLDAVTVGPGPGSELDVGEPRRILDYPELRGYDLLPGGRKFIALERVPGSGIQTRLTLVFNWFRELEATGR
jgi:dipeptidyl aminopeptidase/acylaminoacyl peptidase